MSKKQSPWFLLLFPPVLFLLVIVLFSIYYGASANGDAGVIAEKTSAATPYILVTVQGLLLGIQFLVFRRQGVSLADIGWRVQAGQKVWKELLFGAIIGTPLGAIWIFALEPALSNLQRVAGDYVPAGSLFPALGAAILPFAIADVLFAPFVEETLYRGFGVARLLARMSPLWTVVLTSLFFGLLHWSGGFWYILTTALLVGVPFAILRIWRKNIYITYGAHLALNLVETLLLATIPIR